MHPYALSSANTRGRQHPEPFPADVDPFEVDRQRVLYSAAFRRLEYKTQVFMISEHDHFRTRLTHTLEVADIARRLCQMLDVNPLAGELIALAHDLGHPPFGHAGETALMELMADHGGFEHNAQSLRVVEYLEHPYPDFRGLNLNYEVREALAKHCTIYDKPGRHPLADGSCGPIEGQVADLSDRVAYDCHDLEDAMGADLVDERDLSELDLWREVSYATREKYPHLSIHAIRRPILDRLERLLLADIRAETTQRIAAANITSLQDVRDHGRPLVGFSEAMEARVRELENFLRERVYRHHRLIRMDDKAKRFIRRLFNAYLDEPRMLPPRFERRIPDQGPHRVVCDYIAGMTDRFCQDEYKRLFEPFERV